MRQTIRFGRVAGIPIGMGLGALVILALLACGLAFGRLPAQTPNRPMAAYLLAGLFAAVVFLGCILAHELGHALIAQRNGVQVESITLWLLGGVAELRGETRSPGAELRIAAVGPAVSVALGLVFGALTAALYATGADRLIVDVFAYLALVNLVLAGFNLIPAAPLDGGRVLRAVVWRVTGDPVRSAVVAARAGRLFGLVLIGLGLLQMLARGSLAGLWWVLIGWFLTNAATAEAQRAVLGQTLHGVRVADVMTAPAISVEPDVVVSQFIHEVALHRPYSTYPMVDADGRLTGLVTLNRIRRLSTDERDVLRLSAIACPPQEVAQARADEPLLDLLPRMGSGDRRVVVTDADGRVIGLVSPSDVSRHLAIADLRLPGSYQHGA